jgi:hypothetical protein
LYPIEFRESRVMHGRNLAPKIIHNTYKLLVEVDIPFHNVPIVGNCDIPLVLYLFQNTISLILCSPLDLLLTRYTEEPDCIVQYCTEVVLCCIVGVRYYTVVVEYYTIVAQCCMGLELG